MYVACCGFCDAVVSRCSDGTISLSLVNDFYVLFSLFPKHVLNSCSILCVSGVRCVLASEGLPVIRRVVLLRVVVMRLVLVTTLMR